MKLLSVENSIQIFTAIAIVVGLVLVVWELQQTKALAVVEIVHGDMDSAAQIFTSKFGEDLSEVLATACFKPSEMDHASAFVLDAYFYARVGFIQRLKVQNYVTGLDSTRETISRGVIREILSFPQGRRWLQNKDTFLLEQPDLPALISSELESEVEGCHKIIGAILNHDLHDPAKTP